MNNDDFKEVPDNIQDNNEETTNNINNTKNSIDPDDVATNISTGVKQEVSTAQEQRQDYLDALSGN